MIKRDIYKRLDAWKNNKQKKALCILGARQVGKTTIIREFARNNYTNFLEINFYADEGAKKIFEGDLTAETIIARMTAYFQVSLEKNQTLIFFDEIQECPNARTAIKFLVEDNRFDYIESGSLLGTKITDVKSFPVGFEEIVYMYPLGFQEFCVACGVQQTTLDYLNKCFISKQPVDYSIHESMLKLFYTYIVVGGMPQVVSTYLETNDIGKTIKVQTDILNAYRQDISKYASKSDKVKIKAIFDSIPAELNDKNRRFIITNIESNARILRYESSFEWLAEAGVAIPCYNVSEPKTPLTLNEKHSLFKLFMGDIGLLCALTNDNIQFSLLSGDVQINMGSILENAVAQQLITNGFKVNYFDSKKYGELDFVIQNGQNIDIIEVKSGNDYNSHPALNKITKVPDWKFTNKIVFCKSAGQYSDIHYVPWYMIMFYKPTHTESFIHKLDLSNL